MTNAELIDLFRNVERSNHPVCNGCPMKYTCDKNQITRCLFGSAADALEAADKKIEQLEKQVAAHEKLVKRCGKQMRKMERENDELQDKLREKIIILQRTKEGYVDG